MISASLTLYKAEQSQPNVGAETARSVSKAGLLSGTQVLTSIGAQPVENVPIGARILTYDGGYQNVLGIDTIELEAGAPVMSVPKGFLGNRTEVLFLPEQELVFDMEMAQEAFVDPFTLIAAEQLEGHWGIKRKILSMPIAVKKLQFSQDEVVWSNIGALFSCPRTLARRSLVEELAAA